MTPVRRKLLQSFTPWTLSRNRIQQTASIFNPFPAESRPDVWLGKAPGPTERHVKDEMAQNNIYSWRPFILRRRALLAYSILFVLLFAATEALYQISQAHQGIATTENGKYYLWTYGPTAVFAVLATFWTRIEYRAKQMSPWIRMANNSSLAPASQSLLLNYWSSWLPTAAIYTSLKHKDFLVALAAIGSVLFKVLIIISTGLLTLANLLVEPTYTQFTTSTTFQDSANMNNAGNLAYFIWEGIQANNLSYPPGTNEQHAFQSFHSPMFPKGAILEAEVDAFSAALECEVADMEFRDWSVLASETSSIDRKRSSQPTSHPNKVQPRLLISTGDNHIQDMTVSVPSCSMTGCGFPGQQSFLLDDPVTTKQNEVAGFGTFLICPCANKSEERMLLLAGAIMQGGTTGTTANSTFTHFTLVNSTQFICTATYAINRALVITNTTSQVPANVEILSSFPNRTLANLNATDVQDVFWSVGGVVALDAAMAQDGVLTPSDISTRLMTINPDALVNVTQNYFQSLLAQVARTTLLGPDDTTITGTTLAFMDRLVLRTVSVRIIEVHLILLLLSAVAMIFLIPKAGVVPRDPDSVGGLSILISESDDLKKSLMGMGPSPSKHIEDWISGNGYQTKNSLKSGQYNFSIQRRLLEGYPEKQEGSIPRLNADTIEWWKPFGASKYAQALGISSAVSVVIALELILRDSGLHNGLINLDPTGYAHYATAYIPAFTMVLIGLIFANIDIATKVFAPFSKLKTGTAASQDLFTNPLKYTTFEALWFSVRTRNYTVICTTIAALLSSFLTIAISGVYVVEKVPTSQPLDLSMLTGFNSSPAAVVGGVTEPFILAALVEVGNLSFPAWTYDELAFASYGLETSNLDADLMRFSAPIPAVRARMNCTLHTKDQLNTSLVFRPAAFLGDTENPLSVLITANQSRFSSCTRNITFTVQHNSVFGSYQSRRQWPCPQWFYVWGNIGASSVENVAAMTCFEDVETLMVNTTLTLPSLAIDTTEPPVPDESTARWFNNFTSNPGYNIFTNITSGGAISNQTVLQDFFQILVAGKAPPPLAAFADPSLTTNMSDAILHLHKVLKAQVYGFNGDGSLRINTTGHPTITGTASNLNRQRLVQSITSTRILQALLVVMALCILIQSFLVSTHEVLPKDPRSVAGLASLLVESKMLELVEGWDGKEECRGDYFKGHVFRIGWFDGSRSVDPSMLGEDGIVKRKVFAIDMVSYLSN